MPAGLAARSDAELRARHAEALELAMVGVAAAVVADPAHRHTRRAGGAQQGALHARARERHGGAQPERTVPADLVERERPVQPAAPAAGARPAGERERAQVVPGSGVDALLGAGGHEPHVAGWIERAQA